MNWKRITVHACLLLIAGVAAGFFEPLHDLNDPQGILISYLATEAALFLVSAGIFVHLAYRSISRPFVHALLAAVLSELVAFGVISLIPVDLPGTPLPLVLIGYAVSLAALVVGTLVGVRLRPMPNNSFKPNPLRGSA